VKFLLITSLLLVTQGLVARDWQSISVEEYVDNLRIFDVEVEEILSENLRRDFLLEQGMPTDMTLLTILQEYGFNTNSNDQTSTLSAQVSKEFLQTGTTVNVTKTLNERPDREEDVTSLRVNQDLWRNSFGRGTRLRRSSLLANRDMLELQVAEAYEDYLFDRLSQFIDLKRSKTELDILINQYDQALSLENNVRERLKQSIASTTDLSRAKIQTLNRKEQVLEAESQFINLSRRLTKLMGLESEQLITPLPLNFEQTIQSILLSPVVADSPRQMRLIELAKTSAEYDLKYRRDLSRPRVNLVAGYTNDDSKRFAQTVRRKEAVVGFRLDIPFGNSTDKAAIAQSNLELAQAQLRARREQRQLEQSLEDSKRNLQRLKEQYDLALERSRLSQTIAKEDERRYMIGRLSLENLLDTKEALFTSESRALLLKAELNREALHWLRLKDQLLVQFERS
jgi:outer membrane protein TolC